MKNISYDQAMELLKIYQAKLIDTQTRYEYEKRHIVGSINIPVEEITEKAYQYFNDRNEVLVVYCLNGTRSIAACDMLQRLGYSNVFNIQGGIDG